VAPRERRAADLAEPLTLARVAQAVGSSVFHLCRAFKRATGSTLHGYRNELRLRRSLDLIADRPRDLTNVALDVGFSSHSHFTQAFGELFGLTPARFRRRLAQAGRARNPFAPRRPPRATEARAR
jgi:AraC-like DNA-binding protein